MSGATKVFQLVHVDICGPIKPSSNGKSNYFLLFIDDFSRKTWVYFLKGKDKAFGAFQKFKAVVENKSGYAIKALRTDRGEEFTSLEFNKFCEAHAIHRFLIVLYSPQQSGVMERKNRPFSMPQEACLKAKTCVKNFRLKSLLVPCTYPTCPPQVVFMA